MAYVKTLHDILLQNGKGGPSDQDWDLLQTNARSAVAVDITNVAEYAAQHYGDRYVDPAEFESIVMPWSVMFGEFRVTPVVRAGSTFWPAAEQAGVAIDRVGLLVMSIVCEEEAAEYARATQQAEMDRAESRTPAELEPTGYRVFACWADCFLGIRGSTYGPCLRFQWLCHMDGTMVQTRKRTAGLVCVGLDAVGRELMRIAPPLMLPLHLAASFAHCRNVRQQEETPTYESRQERRVAERRGEPYPVKYYTLRIDPNATRTTSDRRPTSGARELPLHIVRGHFSTYSEEKPLFGKYAGRFWIPAHVRGSEKVGKVFKDYSINAPEEQAA